MEKRREAEHGGFDSVFILVFILVFGVFQKFHIFLFHLVFRGHGGLAVSLCGLVEARESFAMLVECFITCHGSIYIQYQSRFEEDCSRGAFSSHFRAKLKRTSCTQLCAQLAFAHLKSESKNCQPLKSTIDY